MVLGLPPSQVSRLRNLFLGLSRGRVMATLFSLATYVSAPASVPEARRHCPATGREAAGRETQSAGGRGWEPPGVLRPQIFPPRTKPSLTQQREFTRQQGARTRARGRARSPGARRLCGCLCLTHSSLPPHRSWLGSFFFFLHYTGGGPKELWEPSRFRPCSQVTGSAPSCFLTTQEGYAAAGPAVTTGFGTQTWALVPMSLV